MGWWKLKHAWILTAICLGYIFWRQGWPSPAFEAIMVSMVKLWMGALAGYMIDTVHFKNWKPNATDETSFNQARRAALIVGGMLAANLS